MLKFRIVNDYIYVYDSKFDSVLIEVSNNVRNSLGLEVGKNLDITELSNALKSRGVDVYENESRFVTDSTAIVLVPHCDVAYLEAIYQISQRGVKIGILDQKDPEVK
jgi:hypothetical protein